VEHPLLEEWFWGLGQALAELRADIEIAASKDINILVVGETGTGKEYVASLLHEQRLRRMRRRPSESTPFVPVNCGAIPENLAESMLFGHERGAFTSARDRRAGKFEVAGQGTLFLDEIQCLDKNLQAKLLRVLQTRKVEALGAREAVDIDCQIVAASNIPLEILVNNQRFRRDLYYRLNVFPLYLPPLRKRKEDLPTIVRGLLRRLEKTLGFTGLEVEASAFEQIVRYDWPGNIRELEHALLYAALRSRTGSITSAHLPSFVTGALKAYLSEGEWDL